MKFPAFLATPLVHAMVSSPVMSTGVFVYAFANGFWPLISGIAANSVPPEVRVFLTGTAYNIGAGGIVSALIGGIIEAFGTASLPCFVHAIEFMSILAVFYSMFTWPGKVAVKRGSVTNDLDWVLTNKKQQLLVLP